MRDVKSLYYQATHDPKTHNFLFFIRTYCCCCCFSRIDAGQGAILAKSKQPLTMDKWHSIKVSRVEKRLKLTVDTQASVETEFPGAFSSVELKGAIILGKPKDSKKR